jgi:hypothetical protein
MFVLFDGYDTMDCTEESQENLVLDPCEYGDEHLRSLNRQDIQLLKNSAEQSSLGN